MALTVADVQQATRRDDLVPGYAVWIRELEADGLSWDGGRVNMAIVARWSESALLYIKRKAWKAAMGR